MLLRTTCAATNKKKCARRIRTHAAQKEGCAERIAPIGTLSQNGYGEDHGTHKRTMGKPDVADIDWSRMLGFRLASFPQKRGHVEQTIIFSNQKRATIFQTPTGNGFAQISRGLTGRKASQGSTGTRVKFSHRPRVNYADQKQKSRRSNRMIAAHVYFLTVGLRAYAGDRYQKFCCGAPGARRPGGSHRRPSAVACSPPREGSA